MPRQLDQLPIRPLTPRDLASCVALSQERGWPSDERKWRLLLTAGNGYGIDDPSGPGLAGVCVLTRYGTPGPDHTRELSAIGMLLVTARHERQGLGQRLMQHAVREAEGGPLVLYATPFGRPLYERLGFTIAAQSITLKGTLLSPTDAMGVPSADLAVRTATGEDLPAVVGLDAEVFGVDRTLLITRLPAFAEQLQVAVNGSTVIGYGALWSSDSHDVVGPLIARDTATAQALITSLAAGSRRPLRMDIDARHEELLGRLKGQGLDPVLTSPVMVRDMPDLPGDPDRRFAPLTMATC